MRMVTEFISNAEIRENTLAVKYDTGRLDIVGKLFIQTEVSGVGSEVRLFMKEAEGEGYQSNLDLTAWVEGVFNDTLVPILGDIDPDEVMAFLGNFSAKEVEQMRYQIEFTIEFERV